MQTGQYVGELRQDVFFAVRQLTKNPGFAAIAILTLALGIGGTTAIFSAVYAVVLQPFPLRNPDRLLVVAESFQGAPGGVSVGNFTDAANGTTAFEGLAAERFSSFNLSDGVTPERVSAGQVTANFFDVMGSSPVLGRTFTPEEDRPGSDRVVVLSHRLWTRRYGSQASIVGRTVRMNGSNYEVIGVMPASFDLRTDAEELWTPVAFTPEQKVMHDEHFLSVYGRLRPGVSRERAQAEFDSVAARVRREYPRDASELVYTTTRFSDQFVGDYRTRLSVLLGAVGVVLLIACGNVANLLLARGAARGREIAVRTALGAGRWRIVRQLLTESVVLALIAAVGGVLLAGWFLGAVVAWSPPGIPRIEQARIDPIALGFAVLMALVSSIVSGLAPALRLARADIQRALRDGARGATGGGLRDRLRSGLIAAEVALSLLLLFGAGLLIRSAIALHHVNPGFDPHGVLTARVTLPDASYSDASQIAATFRHMADDASALPGVTHAAVSSWTAMGPGGGTNGLLPEGRGEPVLRNLIPSTLRVITPGFFQTMRVAIVRGRAFDERDRRGGLRVMIVSETLAARAFPGQDPIGKRIGCCEQTPDGQPVWKVIVGVARDIRSRGPAEAPRPEFYLPLDQAPDDAWRWINRTMYIAARTEGDPASLIQPLKSVVARIDRDLPLFNVRLMDERLARALAGARFNTLLLSLLGAVGLLLAASGIYGVVAYFVSQRTREIGVRIALGATRGAVVRLVLVQAMRPVVVGAIVGLASAFAASRVLTSQLFQVSRTDPLTITVVAATLVFVALVASAMPARRAAAVDPTRALQAD